MYKIHKGDITRSLFATFDNWITRSSLLKRTESLVFPDIDTYASSIMPIINILGRELASTDDTANPGITIR
jgi:hypothetical protein